MAVREQSQMAIGEQTIEDAELEAALEDRETARVTAADARKAFREVDEVAKGRINELELGEAPARCGRFLIGVREVAGRSVTFDTEPKRRVSIRVVGEEVF